MPLYIILSLIAAKATYLYFESIYNFNVLDRSTSLDITREELLALETMGHAISSIGLTLLVTPLFYRAFKRFIQREGFVISLTLALSFISYNGFYRGLEEMMDAIIAKNTGKRYDAYYLNALKYGILNKSFGYEEFIPKDFSSTDDIKNKVMLTNIFMLTFIDKNLIDSVRDNGREVIFELYSGHNFDYKKNREQFNKIAKEIKEAWEKYNKAQADIKHAILSKNKEEKVNALGEKKYKEFTIALNSQFDEYRREEEQYEIKKDRELKRQLGKIDDYYKDLKTYFRWKGNSRAEKKYKESMHKNFARYIEPMEWCIKNECPSKSAIVSKIKQEVEREAKATWKNKTGGLPFELDHRGFLTHPITKKRTIAHLRKEGIKVSNDFNYSKKQFLAAFFQTYQEAVDKKINDAIAKLRNEFKLRANIENIPLNLRWSDFVRLFEPQIIEKFASEQYGKKAAQVIIDKDLSKIDDLVFKPMFLTMVNEKIFTREDFEKNEEAARYGDHAMKMLYIPPFALSMSIIAGVLNALTIMGSLITLLFFVSKNKRIRLFANGIKALGSLFVLGLILMNSNKQNYFENIPLIAKLKESHYMLHIYLHIIEPIIYLEHKNYNLIKYWHSYEKTKI